MKHFKGVVIAFVAALAVWGAIGAQTNSQSVAQSAYGQPAVAATANQIAAPVVAPVPTGQSYGNTGLDSPTTVAAPNGTYTNVDGNSVLRPYYASSVPAGASARCGDGTYSFSRHRQGTCSHHGGVSEWLD